MGLDEYFSDVFAVFYDYPFIRYGGAFLLGLCLGSFSSAVAYRAPRNLPWAYERSRAAQDNADTKNNHTFNQSNTAASAEISAATGAADNVDSEDTRTSSLPVRVFDALRGWTPVRSMCPACKTTLTGRDLVPVLSWVLTRGRCRHCGVRVPARYPLLELFAGFVALAIMTIVDIGGGVGYGGVAVLLMMLPFVMALFMALRENGRLSWKIMFIIIMLFVVFLSLPSSNL